MASRELGIDDFVGHRTGGGGDLKYLSKWKDRDSHQADVLLHRKAGIHIVWRHQVPRIVVLEDKKTKQSATRVFPGNLVCWEDESVLKKQTKYHDDGSRLIAPSKCGICLMIEHVRKLVNDGELNWTDEVFEFAGDDPKEAVTIHAGGLYNAFSNRDMSAEESKDLKSHGISPRDAWKENTLAKANYVFRVVDIANPGDGVQVAIEPALLGDKVKKLIRDQKEQRGDDEGNPLKHPYVIRWKYLENEQEFHKKYDANAMLKIAIPPEVMSLITDSTPPDVSNIVDRFNAKSVRAMLEAHCKVDLPWDDLFGANEAADAEPADERPARPGPAKAARAKEPEPEEDMFGCDECGKPMRATETKCKACGKVYEVEEAPKPPPAAAPKLPKRSDAKKAAAAPPARAAKAEAPSKAAAKPKDPEPDDIGDEDVPF